MIKRFVMEEEGQTLVEYGLLVLLIILIVIGVLALLVRRGRRSSTWPTVR